MKSLFPSGMLKTFLVALFVFGVIAPPPGCRCTESTEPLCRNDEDCVSDRLCVQGRCQDPPDRGGRDDGRDGSFDEHLEDREAPSDSPKSDCLPTSLFKTLEGRGEVIWGVLFHPDGKKIASISSDKMLQIWDVATGKLLKNVQLDYYFIPDSLAYSPDGKILVIASSENQKITRLDTTTSEIIQPLLENEDWIFSISFHPTSKVLVTGDYGRKIKFWDVQTGKLLKTLLGHNHLVSSVSFSPDGKLLASGSGDTTIKLWDAESGNLLKTLAGHKSLVVSVSFSADGKLLASGSSDGSVRVWDVTTGGLLHTFFFKDISLLVLSVSFHPDGKTVASGYSDATIRFWDVQTGKLLTTLSGHKSYVESVSFRFDGEMLASASRDTTIKLWVCP